MFGYKIVSKHNGEYKSFHAWNTPTHKYTLIYNMNIPTKAPKKTYLFYFGNKRIASAILLENKERNTTLKRLGYSVPEPDNLKLFKCKVKQTIKLKMSSYRVTDNEIDLFWEGGLGVQSCACPSGTRGAKEIILLKEI